MAMVQILAPPLSDRTLGQLLNLPVLPFAVRDDDNVPL